MNNNMVKDVSKKHKKYIWLIIPMILCMIIVIGIFGILIYAYSKQYNLKGVSNILSVYIDRDRVKRIYWNTRWI